MTRDAIHYSAYRKPAGLLREAYRVLASGGEAAIIHWRTDIETPRGPSLQIRPTTEQSRAWGEEAGFEFARYETLCCCSWHWGLLMHRPLVTAPFDLSLRVLALPS
jgi:hypothetical protein